jgi:hypothetical protein
MKEHRMRDPAKFRKYAEECRRLANIMPKEHRGTLLKIADAWIECAQDAERDPSKKDPSDSSEDSAPRSNLGTAKENRAGQPPPWRV